MVFKKRSMLWNKGKHWSEEIKQKLSETQKVDFHTEEWRRKVSQAMKGHAPWMKGYHHSKEARKKISESKIGEKNPAKRPEVREKIRISLLGRHHTEYSKKKISLSLSKRAPWNKGKKGVFTEDTLKKLRENAKTNPNSGMKGKYHTDDMKRKMSEMKKGKHLLKETKKKISEANKGEKHYNFGKHRSEETKRKIKEARLKQVFPIKDTKPELKLQKELTQRGIAYEKHKLILGQPDIFLSPNICIFVDGCWWHNCPYHHKLPFNGKAIDRDMYVTEKLEERGYVVLRFWEHEINKNIDKVVETIHDFWMKRNI